MKKFIVSWICLGVSAVCLAEATYVSNPISVEEVDKIFCKIELQIKALNNQPLVCTS